jgi:hypothetical protein
MRYISALRFGLLILCSCMHSTGNLADQDRISGLYVLERVNGNAIPTPVAPQQGCSGTAKKGTLVINPAGPDVLPMYDWGISIQVDCSPVPAGVVQGADDVGTWRFESTNTHLAFNSMKGRGAYSTVLEETPGTPPAITLLYLGDSYRFKLLVRPDDPQGVVFVKVVDQDGQPVAGVVLIFTFANGLEGGGTTPASGEFGTKGVVGDCKISFTPPAGYQVPSSQPNPVSVSVVQDPAIRIQVSLLKI